MPKNNTTNTNTIDDSDETGPPDEQVAPKKLVATGENVRDMNPPVEPEDARSEFIEQDIPAPAQRGLIPVAEAGRGADLAPGQQGEIMHAKALLDAQPKVMIILPQQPMNEPQWPDKVVMIMDYAYNIQRGVQVSVPESVVENLVNAGDIPPPAEKFRKFQQRVHPDVARRTAQIGR